VGTVFAVALSVTLVSGTFVLTDTINAAFRRATAPAEGQAASDLIVRSTAQFSAQAAGLPEREPVPESLLARVSAVAGVQAVWGAVQGYAGLVGKDGNAIAPTGLPSGGSGWAPGDVLETGRAPQGPGEVAIDAATARRNGLVLGDRIKVLFQGTSKEFTIGGFLKAAGGVVAATKAIFDPTTAQQVLGEEGKVDTIPVRAAPGTSPEALRTRINAVLPERYEAVTAAQVAHESEQSWAKAVSFLPTALLLFAAVALLVGAFLIFNTFSILVAQRSRELGLLRALGASRAQLTTSVLIEASAVGVVGSLIGVGLGFVAAHGLLAMVQGMGIELPASPVIFLPRTALAGVIAGVLVTTLAAVPAARQATRVTPIGAIRGQLDGVVVRRRLLGGVLIGVIGTALLGCGLAGLLPPVSAVAGGVAAVMVGLAILAPLVAGPAARLIGFPLVRAFGEPAFLGRENAMRSPRRTAATAAALMIGIGLVGVVAIVAASMKASATRTVQASLRADFVLTSIGVPGASGGLPPAVADRVRATPGVAGVSELRGGQWGLDGRAQSLLAVDPATVTAMHDVDAQSAAAVRNLDDKGVLVRTTTAERYGWRVGDDVNMAFARTGTRKMRLRGTFATTAVRADYVITLGAYAANFAQQMDLEVDVALKAGVSPAAGRAALRQVVAEFPVVRILDRSQVVAAQEDQVNRLLGPVTALLGLSVAIALLGIANTLGLAIHERTRELGLLRAIGMARRQLRSMICSEAVITACLGAVMGIVVAVVFGAALVTSMRHLGVSELVFPTTQLAGLVALAVFAGLLAGVVPARRAASLGILDALGRAA